MPQQSSQSINDGQATPVAHVFSPIGAFSEAGEVVAKYINRAASTLTGGAEQLLTYFRQLKDGSLSIRHSTLLPITETVAGVASVTRVLQATTTFKIPANATAAERKNLRALHTNSLAPTTNVGVAVENGEGVW